VRPETADGSFDDFYRANYRAVFRYVLVLTRNPQDAEDAAAETFERAFQVWSRGEVRAETAVRWLLVLARRRATDRWRRARRALRMQQGIHPRANDGLRESEGLVSLDEILRLLPSRQREVLALRYQHDLTDRDIALVMGLSESGVRSLAARAIANLRKHPEVWE
jgi:RNA polymerase sigma factor (sigma-70 family)